MPTRSARPQFVPRVRRSGRKEHSGEQYRFLNRTMSAAVSTLPRPSGRQARGAVGSGSAFVLMQPWSSPSIDRIRSAPGLTARGDSFCGGIVHAATKHTARGWFWFQPQPPKPLFVSAGRTLTRRRQISSDSWTTTEGLSRPVRIASSKERSSGGWPTPAADSTLSVLSAGVRISE